MSTGSEFVVVANRLPVDLETLPDGTEWKRSPGARHRSGADPARGAGAWVGWPGWPTRRPTRSRTTAWTSTPWRCPPRRWRTTTRASPTPRFGRSTTTSSSRRRTTGTGGRRTSGSTSGSPRPSTRSRPRARRLGAGLPAPAGARPSSASGARTCGSGSSCTSRSRRSSCSSSSRGGAIIEGLLGADLVGFHTPGGRPTSARWRSPARRGGRGRSKFVVYGGSGP